MRRTLALSIVLLAACASATTSSAPTKPATQTIGGGGVGSITMATLSSSDVAHLPYSPDAIWRILPSVFDSVGVPITVSNPATRTIGNNGYKVRQRLGKVSLSRYLDCGNSQIGPNADSYDVFLSVMTTVAPDGTTASALTTVVEAQARPATYNQAYNRCSSKGGIESRLADLVKARLSR